MQGMHKMLKIIYFLISVSVLSASGVFTEEHDEQQHHPGSDTAVVHIAPEDSLTHRSQHEPIYSDRSHSRANSIGSDEHPLPLVAPLHLSQINLLGETLRRQSLLTERTPINTSTLLASINRKDRTLPLKHTLTVKTDREAAKISEMARVIPVSWIYSFKEKMVLGSGLFIQISDIAKYLSCAMALYCVNSFLDNSDTLGFDLQKELLIISVISYKMCEKISELFSVIKIRDELRLESYKKTTEFRSQREAILGSDRYYTDEEIVTFLVDTNEFKTFPSKWEYNIKFFTFNTVCFSESFFQIIKVFATGTTFMFIFSRIMDEDPFGFGDQKIYSRLATYLISGILVLHILDKKRSTFKEYCENWLVNYYMLSAYFISVEKINQSDLNKGIHSVPENLVKKENADLEEDTDTDDVTVSILLKQIGSSLFNAGKSTLKLIVHGIKQFKGIV
jgi:hypothetical protein